MSTARAVGPHPPSPAPARTEAPDARRRILDAGVRCLVDIGADRTTMAHIADAAGVSKALVHYHFAHRATLFGELALRLAKRIAAREGRVLEQAATSPVVDDLREWLLGELRRGEIRALLELGTMRDPAVGSAVARAAEVRRTATTHVVVQVFERLSLVPRLPAPLIADAAIALVNGLALAGETDGALASFDTFWLGALTLTS